MRNLFKKMKGLAGCVLAICFTTLFAATTFAVDKDGIVLYLPFDEGQGKSVVDQSDKGNDGKIIGDANWVEGKNGKALEFNGTSDFVEVPNSPSLNITGEVTILAWIKLAAGWIPLQYGNIAGINKVGGQAEDAYFLNVGYFNKEHDKVSLGIIGEGVVETPLQGKTMVPQDTWTFVGGVFSPGKFMRVYIDGKLDGEQLKGVPQKIHVAPTSFTVGAIVASPNYSFGGIIDDVVVYERALTENEIQSVMKLGPLSVTPAGKLAVAWGKIKSE